MSKWKETAIGLIPVDWQYVPFQSVLSQPLRNGIYKSKDYHGRGTRVVNMGEMFAFDKLPSIDMARIELSDDELEKSCVVEGDLLFARRSLVAEGAGKCTLVLRQEEPLTFESSIIRARPHFEKADSAYLLYLFSSPIGKYLLKTILRQVAVSGITSTDLSNLDLPLPNLEEQKKVSYFLSCLDRKISNLHQQNETLESIAQTLFKHWFVDFEFPNEDGKPYKSSGGAMVRSDLGDIPVGWEVGKLDDVLQLVIDYRGRTPKKLGTDWSLTGIPALSAKNIKSGRIVREDSINFVDKDLYKKWMKDELQKGDVLLTSEAPLGELLYLANNKKYVLSQRLFSLRVKESFSSSYLYFWLKSSQGQFLLERRATGSTVEGIRQVELRKVEIIIPTLGILAKATNIWIVALEKIESNIQQIQTLTQMRDRLLPKLMSGQLRIPE